MYFVYILKSEKDSRTYAGFCRNLKKRLNEHNKGSVDATKHRRPFNVLFFEKVKDLNLAKEREKYWKSGGGSRKIKKLFATLAQR